MWSGWVQGNSNGLLVPMVQLVPIENGVIPMVLLMNMRLIKETYIIFHVILLGTGQLRWSIGTNGSIGANRKWCHSNGSTGEYAFH